MKDCIFCCIVKNEIPCYKVWEDEEFLAFLTISPIKTGHTLVIPKKHHSYIYELEDTLLQKYILAGKKVATILKKAFNPKTGKIGTITYGLDLDHVHIHLVPIDKAGDLSFKNEKFATREELQKTLDKIKLSLD